MFTIYDTQGQRFRGTLEKLADVPPVTNSHRSRAENRDDQRPGTQALHPDDPHQRQQAEHAYKEAVKNSGQREPVKHAHEMMSQPVISVRPEQTIREVWRLLRAQEIKQAPVINDDGLIIGIISRYDLLPHLVIDEDQVRYADDQAISEIMSSPVVTADPVCDVRGMAKAMTQHNISAMPIVNEAGQLLGMITRGDILRYLANEPPLSIYA